MSVPDTYNPALAYHRQSPAGKLSVVPTKSLETKQDLALAYSPGVAGPVLAIAEDPSTAYDYTAKGNLVAVISNGTAILGLGNRGALASKPVMEGKAVLFKKFAGIDAFDIELNSTDPQAIIEAVSMLEPTFGGINLEDIRAPDCFEIEEELLKRVSIPLMHDDQHGTAVVAGAALLNALHLTQRSLIATSVVMNGAGAAGIAIAKMLLILGLPQDNLIVCDSHGVLHEGRQEGMHPSKTPFLRNTPLRTLDEALRGADVFVGVSKANTVSEDMVRSMNKSPIILALANPDPEIPYSVVRAVRPDAIMATGRSDHPNQVNNVLCFPFMFRAALDTRATKINDAMKRAAVEALATLARQPVPPEVLTTYGLPSLDFGPEYILPKPFDPRLLTTVTPAIALAAMESGVAQKKIDLALYTTQLLERLR